MLNILVIEDSIPMVSLLTEALSGAGHHVLFASSVLTADEMLRVFPKFDVVICDHELPDGFGTTVLELPRCRAIKYRILFSGDNRTKEIALMSHPPTHHLSKDKFPELIELVESFDVLEL